MKNQSKRFTILALLLAFALALSACVSVTPADDGMAADEGWRRRAATSSA